MCQEIFIYKSLFFLSKFDWLEGFYSNHVQWKKWKKKNESQFSLFNIHFNQNIFLKLLM